MKYHHMLFCLSVIVLLLSAQPFYAEDTESSDSTSWQEKAHKLGLSEKDIYLLDKNRILITNDACKQIFSLYIRGKEPLFITSDSLLNAYHVIYEESIIRLESTMAERLPVILKTIQKNINDTHDKITGKPLLVSSAKKRAVLVTGIALKLMDDSFSLKNRELNAIIKEETKRIIKAEGILMPEWLGIPDESFSAIDYSRFRPRGFYTESDQLKNYFRAVSWLQSIPFRVSKDEEFLSIMMLGNSISYRRLKKTAESRKTGASFMAYRAFIGAGDDLDLLAAEDMARNEIRLNLEGDGLERKRSWLVRSIEEYRSFSEINDQVRFAPADPGKKKQTEPEFRIISAYRIPDAILFQRTTDPTKFNRSFPEGLEVLTALGSDFARHTFKDENKADVLNAIESCRAYFKGKSLYFKYLDALRTLVDEPEHDAPDFMKNNAWKIKSSNTALSGWAQLRHTWVLQAKQSAFVLSATMVPEGFVEPEPDFFYKMSELISDTRSILIQAGAFEPDIDKEYKADLDKLWEKLEKTCRRLEIIAHKQLRHVSLNESEITFIKGYGETIAGIMMYAGNSYLHPEDDAMKVSDVYASPAKGGYLHAGTARPRKMYVLYPWKGQTILCVGGIVPYYEFINSSRLDDESWKEILDSEKRPALPEWTWPVVTEGGLGKPKYEKFP